MDQVNCNVICETGDLQQVCLTCNMAKTAHGKAWEGPVCKMFIDDIGYGEDKEALFANWETNSRLDATAPHDISEELMGIEWSQEIKDKYGDGLSVKLIKKGCEVCMGKIERIWNHFEEGQFSCAQKGRLCICQPWSTFRDFPLTPSHMADVTIKNRLTTYRNNKDRMFSGLMDPRGFKIAILEKMAPIAIF